VVDNKRKKKKQYRLRESLLKLWIQSKRKLIENNKERLTIPLLQK